jgi:DNA-binding response OmpR family regulator
MDKNGCNTLVEEKPLILLVDDVPENLQILHEILNNGEYSFAIASSGKESLRIVGKKVPDLILLDIMMPDIDGFEVCRELKSNPAKADVPIIFLTAKVAIEDKIKGFELGAVDYITKPFEAAEVIARVKTHVRLKKTLDLVNDCNMQLSEHLGEMLYSYRELKGLQDGGEAGEMKENIRTMTSDASHEINQPLTVLIGYLELLKETIDPECVSDSQKKYLDRMENALKKLMVTVETFRKCSATLENQKNS